MSEKPWKPSIEGNDAYRGHEPDTLREHQRKAGQSKSPKKLKALTKARKLAAKANRSDNPSPGALYQRKRRARLKLKEQSSGVPCTKTASRRRHRPK